MRFSLAEIVGMGVLAFIALFIVLFLSAMFFGWLLMILLMLLGASLGYWTCVAIWAIGSVLLSAIVRSK